MGVSLRFTKRLLLNDFFHHLRSSVPCLQQTSLYRLLWVVYQVHRPLSTGHPCGLGSQGSCKVYRSLFTDPHSMCQVYRSLLIMKMEKKQKKTRFFFCAKLFSLLVARSKKITPVFVNMWDNYRCHLLNEGFSTLFSLRFTRFLDIHLLQLKKIERCN